ncbi:hypothetical protein ACA910_000772 [Epithemia clementina (nom. ined.)]
MKAGQSILFWFVAAVASLGHFHSNHEGRQGRTTSLRRSNLAIGTALSLFAVLGLQHPVADAKDNDFVKTGSGLSYRVVTEGYGDIPGKGETVKVHYTGWLGGFYNNKFDSSYDRKDPFMFRLGTGSVIPGWDECVSTMQIGEQREVIIPPKLGYGDKGAGGVIPPGATLYFDIKLLGIFDSKAH